MIKFQQRRMKRLPREQRFVAMSIGIVLASGDHHTPGQFRAAVVVVAGDGVTDVRQMHSDLVGAAGGWLAQQ